MSEIWETLKLLSLSHFSEEKTEAQGSNIICPSSHMIMLVDLITLFFNSD